MRRTTTVALVAFIFLVASATAAAARPPWKRRVDRAIGSRAMGVAVTLEGRNLYRHKDRARRTPASNEKLLMSMALLHRLSPRDRIPTIAAASSIQGGRVVGDLWLLGRGDPSVTDGGRFARGLPFRPTRVGKLARRIDAAGIKRITGSVRGSTGYFARDWYAPGWKPTFPVEEVPLPSALALDGNTARGAHVTDPERRAAEALTKQLRKIGVRVAKVAGEGPPPSNLERIATVRSVPLRRLMTYMNWHSSNFFAEMLGKRLGMERFGRPGTIDKGGDAIAAYARRLGVPVVAEDSSGLSYSNRVSPRGMVKLLDDAEDQEWGPALREMLPGPDQGTLDDRLRGVRMRAKTGTLNEISTLSGWVWLRRSKDWANFSIMSKGMSKFTAMGIEDEIVRILHRSAR